MPPRQRRSVDDLLREQGMRTRPSVDSLLKQQDVKRRRSVDDLLNEQEDKDKPGGNWLDTGISAGLRFIPSIVGTVGGVTIGTLGGATAGTAALPVAGTVAGGISGGTIGASVGGSAGSALGEFLGQKYEQARGLRDDVNYKSVLAQGAIGAIPLGASGKILANVGKGALMGAGNTTAMALTERGEAPSVDELAGGAVLGGAFGGGTAAVMRKLGRGAKVPAKAPVEAPDAALSRALGLEPEVAVIGRPDSGLPQQNPYRAAEGATTRPYGLSTEDWANRDPLLATVPDRLRPEPRNATAFRNILPRHISDRIDHPNWFDANGRPFEKWSMQPAERAEVQAAQQDIQANDTPKARGALSRILDRIRQRIDGEGESGAASRVDDAPLRQPTDSVPPPLEPPTGRVPPSQATVEPQEVGGGTRYGTAYNRMVTEVGAESEPRQPRKIRTADSTPDHVLEGEDRLAPSGVEARHPGAAGEEVRALLEEYDGALMNAHGGGRRSLENIQAQGESHGIEGDLAPGLNFKNSGEAWTYMLRESDLIELRMNLKAKIADGSATSQDIQALAEVNKRLPGAVGSVSSGLSEAGRSLRVGGVEIPGNVKSVIQQGIRAARKAGLNDAEIEKLLEEVGEDNYVGWADAMLKASARNITKEQILSGYFTANLLFGPVTQLRNIFGNTVNLATKPALTPFAAAIDRFNVWNNPEVYTQRTVYAGEIPAQLRAIKKGFNEGWDEFKYVMQHGFSKEPIAGSTGTLDFNHPEMPAFYFRGKEIIGGGIKNPANALRRFMSGTDSLFRKITEEMDIAGQSYTKARNLHGKGTSEFQALFDELRLNPTAEMRAAAQLEGARTTFQEKSGAATQSFLDLKAKYKILHYLGMTFVKTPGAIAKQGIELTPMGLLMKGAKGAAGATDLERRAIRTVQARAMAGTAAAMPLWLLAASDRLTGAMPLERSARAEWEASGKQANSIKIGDRWVNYMWAQPLAMPLSMVASAYESWTRAGAKDDELQPMIGRVMGSIVPTAMGVGRSILDQNYLMGISNLLKSVASEDERFIDSYAANIGQGFVPASGLLRTAQRATDQTYRRPQSAKERFKAALPGLSQSVNPRLDRFGQPVIRPGGVVGGALNIFGLKKDESDPVSVAMKRAGVRVSPSDPIKTIALGNRTEAQLTPEDAFAAGQFKGQELYDMLLPLISGAGFDKLPIPIQRDRIERKIIQSRSRSQAKIVAEQRKKQR